ncbi:adenosylmethionine---8-amino-7-oxononanoate aminotransferase [Fistulifera solaris]|uniref:Adenosylmethionine---8-amino-7-oxononanoate aminotransferase n=1 Tax=Fistulifera solaris TaxID=1519565 RepID=A0A1Z5KNB6_FISSO|nr:adenosylmethionine---8-amino-7-oxononanoate aminotransferase [Fistulifera solaris]|eukprot:GAX27418.1 adenosylmethionine---8-amino-7-oxononanoate aminotransferase [Fistulifera solaris]
MSPALVYRASLFQKRLFSSVAPSSRWRITPKQRTNIIFGANTDVGKTVISAGLVQASSKQRPVHYIKPLQCGGSDQDFVERHVKHKSQLTAQTLFSWDTPASPHTACTLENKPVGDEQILSALTEALQQQQQQYDHLTSYIETAGGALSPASASPENCTPRHALTENQWGWIPQADLYQELAGVAPVVLVGDGRLGGISATLAALEVVIARGYDVAALVLLENGYDNVSAIRALAERKALPFRSGTGERLFHVPSQSIISLPPIPEDPEVPLFEWYESTSKQFSQLDDYLQNWHEGQVHDWRSMPKDASSVLWYPNIQHKNTKQSEVAIVNSATKNRHHLLEFSEGGAKLECVQSDDMSVVSTILGHADSTQNLATTAALGRYGRLDLNPVVTSPSLTLAQTLGADKVLYAAGNHVEAALYMALRTYHRRKDVSDPQKYDWAVAGQEGCYHGDTLGALNVAGPRQTFVEDQHPWYSSKSLLFETPTWAYKYGTLKVSIPESYQIETEFEFESIPSVMDISTRLISHRKLHSQYKEMIEMQLLVYEHSGVNRKIGGAILEPVMAGLDCNFVDPLWQRALVDVATSRGVPVIFDERMSGMYRFGILNAERLLQVKADIVCYGGGTGGAPSTIATTNEVFETFLGDESGEALLFGHLNAAQPDEFVRTVHELEACKAIIQNDQGSFMAFDEKQVSEISLLPHVESVATFGSVMKVALIEPYDDEYKRTNMAVALLRRGGLNVIRHDNIICAMVSPTTASRDYCIQVCERIVSALKSLK